MTIIYISYIICNLRMANFKITLPIFLSILIFLLGMYFYIKPREGFGNQGLSQNGNARCPDILIRKGASFYLYNSNIAKVPGVNPVEFTNLEDYTEFLDWQKSQGIRCPVLFVQHTYDIHGNEILQMRPSVSEMQAGLPSTTSTMSSITNADKYDPLYNQGSFPSYDQYSGSAAELD
jgi:hypothetical protein